MPKIDWRSLPVLLTAGLIIGTRSPITPPAIGDAIETASADRKSVV